MSAKTDAWRPSERLNFWQPYVTSPAFEAHRELIQRRLEIVLQMRPEDATAAAYYYGYLAGLQEALKLPEREVTSAESDLKKEGTIHAR